MKIITYIQLHNGRFVEESFLELIRENVCEVLPAMQPNIKYTLKVICGNSFWDSLGDGQRRTAGQCMVHFVKTGKLPLGIAESVHEYPVHYQLK